jgi:hypothetical protein
MDEAKLSRLLAILEKRGDVMLADDKFKKMTLDGLKGNDSATANRIRELLGEKKEEKRVVKRKIKPAIDVSEKVAEVIQKLVGGDFGASDKYNSRHVLNYIPKEKYDAYISKLESKKGQFVSEFVRLLKDFREYLDEYNEKNDKNRQTITFQFNITNDETTLNIGWASVIEGSKKGKLHGPNKFRGIRMTEYL